MRLSLSLILFLLTCSSSAWAGYSSGISGTTSVTNCPDAYVEINYQAEWGPGDDIPNPKTVFPAGMIKSTTITYDPIANPRRVTMVTKWTVPSTPGTYEVKAYVQVGENKYAEKILTITVTNCPTTPGGPGGGGLE